MMGQLKLRSNHSPITILSKKQVYVPQNSIVPSYLISHYWNLYYAINFLLLYLTITKNNEKENS